MGKTLRQQFPKIDNLGAGSHEKKKMARAM
jgi:hypothetical protein